jgi:hypothetical protein
MEKYPSAPLASGALQMIIASGLAGVIDQTARAFAANVTKAAARATTEADIRSAIDRELMRFEQTAGVRLEARHEFTVASGRVDSVYDRVIIEYKNPASKSERIGSNLTDSGTAKLISQIKSRFGDFSNDHGQSQESLFGVGIDGQSILFVRYREGQWLEERPVPITPASVSRLLWALCNLGIGGRPFSAECLARDFGGRSEAASSMVNALYSSLRESQDSKVLTLYAEWQSLFGIVCGYDALASNPEAERLADLYGVPKSGLDFRHLLFSAHTYYALIMKLLSAEIVGVYHGLPSTSQRILQAATTQLLKRELENLEAGGIFQHIGIRNFLEGDLFSWYLRAWNSTLEKSIRHVAKEFDGYNLGSISQNPSDSQDLLKDLYMELLPREVRHSLGEYYTPDWLVELVLDEVGFDGRRTQRLLDPACGSGSFLVQAISRIRGQFDLHRESYPGQERGLLEAILRDVVGFDINPLAVLASRTNYLIAVRDLLKHSGEVELPVFLADSVSTPTEYDDLFTSSSPVARVPCAATKPPFLLVPREIGATVESVNKFTQCVEHALRVKLSADEYLDELRQTGVEVRNVQAHLDLYRTMENLRDQQRDGIWARIIKNSFAPLFVGRFEFVVGNPPWVNWENLAPEYRKVSEDAWSRYRLSGPLPGKRRQASSASKTDVCVLMTYVALDKYVTPKGKVGFVLPRTIFQSETGGWHFRRFKLPNETPISVEQVHDVDLLKPFRSQATNTSCFAIFSRGRQAKYPTKWKQWRPSDKSMRATASLSEVRESSTIRHLIAEPIDQHSLQSPWIIGSKAALTLLRKSIGRSPYADLVREGLNTRGANGVYFVAAQMTGSRILATNLAHEGRNENVSSTTLPIDEDYLFPLLRGEDVARFRAIPRNFVVVPHDSLDPVNPVRFASLPRLTREFLSEFREVLSSRKKFRNFDPASANWHGLYSVLSATFSPHKVVWREMTSNSGIIAAAVADSVLPNGKHKVVLPDHKLSIIPCGSAEEADFVAGFINSDIVNLIVRSYAVATGISTHILERVPLPRFSKINAQHVAIANLARQLRCGCDDPTIAAQISLFVAQLIGLSENEFESAQRELGRL